MLCFLRPLLSDDRGGVVAFFALSLVPILGLTGAAVDYVRLAKARGHLQNVADMAASNAAKAMLDDGTLPLSQLEKQAKDAAMNTVRSQAPDSTPEIRISVRGHNGAGTSSAYVALSETKPLVFGRAIGASSSIEIGTRAKASPGSAPGCGIIALDPASAGALTISGNGTVDIPNCSVYVNSTSASGLVKSGSGWLRAKFVGVLGGSWGSNFSPAPKRLREAFADPLANIPQPTVPATCTHGGGIGNATIPANSVFCGSINFTGNITFAPGIHYFKGASVDSNSHATLSGDGVMLFFDNTSTVSLTSSAAVNLKAMQTGTYAGIAMFGSRAASLPTFRLRGNSSYNVGGTIYLPAARLELSGTSDIAVTSKSGYVIARQFSYAGDSSFTFDGFGAAVPTAMVPKGVTLTE